MMRVALVFIFLCCFPLQATAKSQEITIAFEEWPASFNPSLRSGTIVFSIGAQIFAGLTRLDEQGKAIPYLAKQWKLSEDKRTYTFYLRENAFFHDRTKIVADDVIFSINFSRKNHPFYPFLENILKVRKIDTYSLEVVLRNPMESFPSFLIPILVPILPQHCYQFTLDKFSVIGSGPFYIENYEEPLSITLKKFDKFFLEDKPKLETINYVILFDFYEFFYALKNNDIDMFMFYPCTGIESYLDITDKNIMKQFVALPITTIYPYMVITYNMRMPLFQDIRVRKALSLALDKEKLTASYQNFFVKPVNGGIPFTHPYYIDIESEFDVKKANELLNQAGYPRDKTGKRFSITIDYLTYSYMSDIIHWIQQEWSKNLGIELLLRDRNVFANIGNENLIHDFELFFDELLLWHDPFIGMYRLYTEKNIDRNKIWTNIGAYKNFEIETLFECVLKEEDTEKKKNLYVQIQKTLANDYASLWLVSNMYYLIMKNTIKGMEGLPYKMMSPMLDVVLE